MALRFILDGDNSATALGFTFLLAGDDDKKRGLAPANPFCGLPNGTDTLGTRGGTPGYAC